MTTLESAVEALRDIAAMGRKAGSETAKNWLIGHGYPLQDGGYVPGKGFVCNYEACDLNTDVPHWHG